MITPAEIVRRLERWWPEVLEATVRGEDFFPRQIPRIGRVTAATRLDDFAQIREQQAALVAQSKDRRGFGYALEWREVNTRKMGRNRFIHAIHLPSLEDYLRVLGRTKSYEQFLADVDLIRAQTARWREDLSEKQTGDAAQVLGEDWIAAQVVDIMSQAGVWPELLAVLDYFVNRHEPHRYYIRELPVAVPTKFIEGHRRILTQLLEAVLPPDRLWPVEKKKFAFEQRFGLRWPQPLVRLRLLDQSLADRYLAGLNDISLPRNVFNRLQLPLRRVLLLENKTSYDALLNFLTLPQCTGSAAVFGAGFRVGALRDAAWLHNVNLLYWGDLDAHGFQIVNQARSYFPHLRTILMDRTTLDALADYHVEGPLATATELPHLTEEERVLYHYLNDRRIRLEQERVPLQMVREALADNDEG